MIFIENNERDPALNQALEEFVFERTEAGETVMMLWRNAPAVVCGCYQNVFAEVDAVKAKEQGVAIIRRMSGGGTVYHDPGNVNYTIIAPLEEGEIDYARFIQPVVTALNGIGIPASMNRTCDIAVNGLKVSGSAQKVAKGKVLHHGTLLYDTDLTRLRQLADGRRDKFTSKGVASTPWPVTNMRGCLNGEGPDTDGFAARLMEKLAPNAQKMVLTEGEMDAVRTLADEKYRSWVWTFGKSPAFECKTDFLLGGLPVSLNYKAKKGVIEEIEFDVSLPVLSEAKIRLMGAELNIETIREKLNGLEGLNELYRALF